MGRWVARRKGRDSVKQSNVNETGEKGVGGRKGRNRVVCRNGQAPLKGPERVRKKGGVDNNM